METLERPTISRPRVSLWSLRVVLTVHLLAVLAQPVLAGLFLTGDVDAIELARRRRLAAGRGRAAGRRRAALGYVLAGRGGCGCCRWRCCCSWPRASRSGWATPGAAAARPARGGDRGGRRCCSPPGSGRRRRPRARGAAMSALSRRGFLGLLGGAAAGVGAGRLRARHRAGPDRGAAGQRGAAAGAVPGAAAGAAGGPAGRARRRPAPSCTGSPSGSPRRRSCPALRTPILGYDGIFPGPTIETRRGRPVVVRHRNELPVPTVVHLHGGHTPAEHDGWPLDLRAAGRRHRRLDRPPRHGRRRRGGRAGLPLPERPAGGHALVPRPPDGLHRPGGLPRAGRVPPRPRRRRGRAAAAPRRPRAAADDLRPGVRRRRLVRLPGAGPGACASLPGVRGRLDGGRARRRRAGQRRAVAGARGRRRALPAAAAQRVQRPPLPARADACRAGRTCRSSRSARTAGCWPRRWARRRSRSRPGERFDVVVDFSVLPVGTEVTMVNALGSGPARAR